MRSKLSQAIGLRNQPVAVLTMDHVPQGALEYKQGSHHCMIPMLTGAAKGRMTALTPSSVGCLGGRSGLGFCPLAEEPLATLLSAGNAQLPGMYYKKDRALAAEYIQSLPAVSPVEVLVLCPLDQLPQGTRPVSVIFLVDPDQLSALVTLASYDRSDPDSVKLRFAAGCAQAILLSMADEEQGSGQCTVGLTDPSARLYLEKDQLSFSIPYARFLELEENAAQSFLTKETWQKLKNRR